MKPREYIIVRCRIKYTPPSIFTSNRDLKRCISPNVSQVSSCHLVVDSNRTSISRSMAIVGKHPYEYVTTILVNMNEIKRQTITIIVIWLESTRKRKQNNPISVCMLVRILLVIGSSNILQIWLNWSASCINFNLSSSIFFVLSRIISLIIKEYTRIQWQNNIALAI